MSGLGQGPTLEIFEYNHLAERPGTAINRPGLAHLAFAADDVEALRAAILQAGGRALGEVVSLPVPGVGTVTFTPIPPIPPIASIDDCRYNSSL